MSVVEHTSTDEARYPLIYRMGSPSRIATVILCLFCAAGAVALSGLALKLRGDMVATSIVAVLALGLFFSAAGGLWYAFNAQITIERNGFEYRRWFTTVHIDRADIVGRRYNTRRAGTKVPVLVLRRGSSVTLQPNVYEFDSPFEAWLQALPDLDAKDRADTLALIEKDVSLGSNRQERLDKLKQAKRSGVWLNVFAVALGVWSFVFPRPYQLVIAVLAVLPWIAAAILWLRPNLYQLDQRRGDIKASLLGLVLAPAWALGVRALADVHVIDLKALFGWGALVGLFAFFVFLMAPRGDVSTSGRGRQLAFVLLPFLVIYGASVMALGDAMWDAGAPGVYRTTVTHKYIHSGKSRSYYVDVAPWNPAVDENEIRVSSSYYDSVQKGEEVCVRLHPGRFGLRWMQLGGCS